MAIPVQHVIVVSPANNASYPFTVLCSCQWQCHCRTREQAIHQASGHAGRQAWMGNPTTVDVSAVPLEEIPIDQPVVGLEGSVETVSESAAAQPEPAATAEAGAGV